MRTQHNRVPSRAGWCRRAGWRPSPPSGHRARARACQPRPAHAFPRPYRDPVGRFYTLEGLILRCMHDAPGGPPADLPSSRCVTG